MLEHINKIDELANQLSALLDLMMCSDEAVDMTSIRTASEMGVSLLDDIMIEVEKIEGEWRDEQCGN